MLNSAVRAGGEMSGDPGAAAADGYRRREARALNADECAALLRAGRWGVLATVDEGLPYAVPVAYGFDGEHLFVAMTEGRKARNVDRTPAVCMTVVEVREIGRAWSSVVVTGHGVWVREAAVRLHGFETLRRQQRAGLTTGMRDAARLARALMLRIEVVEMSGRAVTP